MQLVRFRVDLGPRCSLGPGTPRWEGAAAAVSSSRDSGRSGEALQPRDPAHRGRGTQRIDAADGQGREPGA